MSDSLLTKSLHADPSATNPDYIQAVSGYAQELESKNLPVIFSTYHLSLLMGVEYYELKSMISSSSRFYKNFKIKKKSGGNRYINSPSELLKIVQQWILMNILEKLNGHANVFSFQKQKSISQNAALHVNQEVVLNLDFYRFFDSISSKRVYGFFHFLGYAKNVAWDLALLTTTRLSDEYWTEIKGEGLFSAGFLKAAHPVLPQGASTSPLLSNFIARRLDNIFTTVAQASGINYSRYADDLCFSGARKHLPSLKFIEKIALQEGFIIHPEKTRFLSRARRQEVTGLTVNDRIGVSREWKKDLRTQLYFCARFGVNAHQAYLNHGTGDKIKDNFKNYLLGKIFFLHSVEPELAKKYMKIFDEIEWHF